MRFLQTSPLCFPLDTGASFATLSYLHIAFCFLCPFASGHVFLPSAVLDPTRIQVCIVHSLPRLFAAIKYSSPYSTGVLI
ncbi:hypothetical protein DFH94DRAFT_781519 [Russula ochroleuca]|uniref:Uncharacterized protein n=1 Tax=Russula ochroleuca TaxID=152965 RepID=A0A9P5MN46_9AGAM|nr:hypothetical protein DFH94DRAFT_781519 [Russula ochroleuca]